MAYLRSWFILDLTLVSLDWSMLFLMKIMSFLGIARSVKLMRITRMLRLLKLIRIMRVSTQRPILPQELLPYVNRNVWDAALTLVVWILAVLILAHLVACGWYGLGFYLRDDFPTWVEVCRRMYLENTDQEPSLSYFYVTSLHWTLTIFTPASMEVFPENSYERVFTIATIFSALIFFSSLLSNISTTVAAFRRKYDQQVKQDADLVQFLQDNQISLRLGSRVQAFIQGLRWETGGVHRIHASAVPQLKQLSPSLKEELACEVYGSVIRIHSMVTNMQDLEPDCISHICQTAMSQQSVMPMHDVFVLGSECKAMYFVVGGEMAYFVGAANKPLLPSDYPIVTTGSWACEYALLIAWEHRGLMTTMQIPCELHLLNIESFQNVLQDFPRVRNFCHSYALIMVADSKVSVSEMSDLPLAAEKIIRLSYQAMEDSL